MTNFRFNIIKLVSLIITLIKLSALAHKIALSKKKNCNTAIRKIKSVVENKYLKSILTNEILFLKVKKIITK